MPVPQIYCSKGSVVLETAVSQINTAAISIICGIFLCLLYDVFRILRVANRPSKLSIFVQDIVYSITAAFVTFFLLLIRCSGEIRFFVFICELIGFSMCRFTVSILIMLISNRIIYCIKAVINLIITKIFRPINLFFDKIKQYLLKKTTKAIEFIKKLLKKQLKVLYNRIKRKKKTIQRENIEIKFIEKETTRQIF